MGGPKTKEETGQQPCKPSAPRRDEEVVRQLLNDQDQRAVVPLGQ